MNKRYLQLSFFICLLLVSLLSCDKKPIESRFIIEGKINNADQKTLYLERTGASVLDSVLLDKEGDFRFSAQNAGATDFYNLRLGKQLIYFVADSTETISVNAQGIDFARDYTITGSEENKKIQDLSLLQLNTLSRYKKLQQQYENKEMSADEYLDRINEVINGYKDVAKQYIFESFTAPSSYFALFQQVDQILLFDPYDKDDLKLYGAISNNYPDSVRREYAKAVYLQGRNYLQGGKIIDAKEVEGKDMFDLSLPSLDDKEVKLSEAGAGKLTLIDFALYEAEDSPLRNMKLVEVYRKYNPKGFEIYQVSFDRDEHFWKNAAYSLPWIVVRDPESIYSNNLTVFNITQIPTSFLRSTNGEIVKRIESVDELESAIKKHLK